MTDFMKNISRDTCNFFDSLPQVERDSLNASIIAEQENRKGLLSVHQVGELLSLGRDGVNNLPLKFLRPFRRTSRGRRQVKSLHKDDLIAFLAGLNSSFANYDPLQGPLLSPGAAVEVFGEDLPEYVQLSSRTRRYRPRATQTASAPSEMIMGDLP